MRTILPLLVFGSLTFAQQAPVGPPVAPCGVQGDVEILCGTHSPEDLELTSDAKYLIVSQFVNGRGGTGAGLALFDIAKKAFSPIAISDEPKNDWGDPACPGPIDAALLPHGISLKRVRGAERLYVVNHGGRQSIEVFELKKSAGGWALVWRGCVPTKDEFNDVAIMPDGGFVATHPTSLRTAGSATTDLFSGQPSGVVVRWTPGKPEMELPGTRQGYPNGVIVSPDGRYMYYNAWTAKEVHKYDLRNSRELGVVKLDFMPDNLTWTGKRQILAAGVKGARGDCPAGSGTPCIQVFGVAEIDPATWQAKTVFDSQGKGNLIPGVSVALQAGDAIYVGAFQGDRLVKLPRKP